MGETDRVEHTLSGIAVDVLPAVAAVARKTPDAASFTRQLQLQSQSEPLRQLFHAVDTHPLIKSCVAAVQEDPQLQPLLPDKQGMEAFVMSSSGGGRVNLASLPLALINAAANEMMFSGSPFTPDALREKALLNLARVRAGVAGQPVEVWNVVGFAGIPLPAGGVVRTPWGEIKPLTAPAWLVPIHGMSMPPWAHVTATSTLMIQTREQLLISHEAQPHWPERFQAEPNRVQRIVSELMPLALVLATADDPLRPMPLWLVQIVPWYLGGGSIGWLTPSNLRSRSRPLEDADLKEVERWCRLVNETYHEELSFVGRRIVTAIGSRWTQEDLLVDSVVAWENLVGGAPETTFRTSTAMACVVHGRLEKDIGQWKWRLAEGDEKVGLDSVANEALQFAMRGLKTIIENRPDLISIKPAERSRRLVMGA
jgi:hypothetical protein